MHWSPRQIDICIWQTSKVGLHLHTEYTPFFKRKKGAILRKLPFFALDSPFCKGHHLQKQTFDHWKIEEDTESKARKICLWQIGEETCSKNRLHFSEENRKCLMIGFWTLSLRLLMMLRNCLIKGMKWPLTKRKIRHERLPLCMRRRRVENFLKVCLLIFFLHTRLKPNWQHRYRDRHTYSFFLLYFQATFQSCIKHYIHDTWEVRQLSIFVK